MRTINTLLLVLAFSLVLMPVSGQEGQVLKTGDKIPVFSLPDENGDTWSAPKSLSYIFTLLP
jgi:hypothetical protein